MRRTRWLLLVGVVAVGVVVAWLVPVEWEARVLFAVGGVLMGVVEWSK